VTQSRPFSCASKRFGLGRGMIGDRHFSVPVIFNIVGALGTLARKEAIMHRSFVLTRALLAVIGLLLAGPQKASADQVFACVNSTTGLLYIVSATTNCPPPSSGATWNKISWNTTAGQSSPGTNLLFPFVLSQPNGLDTTIAISNTSADPFNTANQTGTCTLSVYSTGTTPATFTTPSIAPGTTFNKLLSDITPSAEGYVFASCTFSYAHGLALIFNATPPLSILSTYLALVVQTPRPSGENLNN
jgi:hypothetical protein